jgi:hypothetical protein
MFWVLDNRRRREMTAKEFLKYEYGIELGEDKALIHPAMLIKAMETYAEHRIDERMPTEDAEKVIEQIEARVETPFVTAQFGNNWEEHIKRQLRKHDCDVETIIHIAWLQGRRSLLFEKELRIRIEGGNK